MLFGAMKVLEQLAEFLVEREVAVPKSNSTWVPPQPCHWLTLRCKVTALASLS